MGTIILLVAIYIVVIILNNKNKKKIEKQLADESLDLAKAYFEAGRYEEAIKELKSIVKKHDSPDAQYYLGLAYYELGLYEEGSKELLEAGIAYENKGLADKAVSALTEIKIDKLSSNEESLLHYHLGVNYHNLGELEKAKTEYEKAIQKNPKFAEGYYGLGLVYHKLGKEQLAWEQLKVIKDLDMELAKKLFRTIE